MTKLEIISRLWRHIGDLLLLLNGHPVKTLPEVEKEMDVTAAACQRFVEADDDQLYELAVQAEAERMAEKMRGVDSNG